MPSSFLTPLELEYVDGRTWKVTKEFDYFVDYGNNDTVIKVPAGFTTDFASIPEVLWNILPPTGKYGKAAVIHDYLYVGGGKVPCGWCQVPGFGLIDPGDCPKMRTYTKKDADQIFLQAMEVLGVGVVERHLMYRAVRWFGRGNFGKV